MKTLNPFLQIFFIALHFLFIKSSAQTISPYLLGQNAWMPYGHGLTTFYGKLNQLWPLVKNSQVQMIRIGGNGIEFHQPTNQEYLALIDSIRSIGAEPIVQVSQGRGTYTAQQAANLVFYINKTMNRNIRYWSIGNEPNLGSTVIDAAGVAAYFKAFASAMKAQDPTILIAGPECAWYDDRYYPALIGGSQDITGKDSNGRYYLDIVSFHIYPFDGNQTRDQVINWPTTGLLPTVNDLLSRISAANTMNGRTGEQALKWALTEFNVDYANPSGNTSEGVGVHSFLNGQFWMQVFGVGMQKGAFSMNAWSIHESDGNRSTGDLGYLDGTNGTTPRSSYYHLQLLSEYAKGNYLISSTNQNLVKSLATRDGSQLAVFILNMHQSQSYNATIRFDNTLPTTTNLGVQVEAGLNKDFLQSIPAQSTVVLRFDLQGNPLTKCTYSLQDYQQNKAPSCGPLSSSILPNTVAQSPYGGTPTNIPGTIEAEKFDTGGEGIAYHDTEPSNQGGQFQTTEGVDIEICNDTGGGYNVGWIADGEWLEYTVNVGTTGNYLMDARVASANSTGGSFRVESDGENKSGTIAVNATGGWQTWTIVRKTLALTAGTHLFRVSIEKGLINLNKFIFSIESAPTNQAPMVSLTSPAQTAAFTVPATLSLTATANDSDGSVAKVEFYEGTTKLGEDTSAPYEYIWANVGAGAYTLTAKAIDNQGATTNSSTVSVMVNSSTASVVDLLGPDCVKVNDIKVYELSATNKIGATQFNWWCAGATQSITVLASGTANYNFGPWFSGGKVCVGVNYNTAPWYKEFCKTVTVCNGNARLATNESAAVLSGAIKIFPNPVRNGQITVVLDDKTEVIASVEVVNLTGASLFSTSKAIVNNSFLLDINHLPAGIYFLRITDAEKRKWQERLVKF